MKFFIILIIFIFIGIALYCQKAEKDSVPAKVKTKINTLYPKAEKTVVAKENTNYKAVLSEDHARITLLLDSIGRLIETSINTVNLPENVEEYLNRNYPGEKIISSEKIISNKGKVKYEVKIDDEILYFNEEKGLIRKRKNKS